MEAQGYGVTTVLSQDNQSTLKLSENGKASSGKGTRRINIRYFFITDRIAQKEVAIEYCPTKQMVADYFTKPLQGDLFYKFRDQIMGVVPMDTITGDHRSVLDVESDDRSSPKKTIAPPQRAHASSKATTHQSWSDVVKSKPSDGSNGPLRPILKRSPILSLQSSRRLRTVTIWENNSVDRREPTSGSAIQLIQQLGQFPRLCWVR
jgi:hypothetical protein